MKANERQVGGKHYKDKSVQPWDAILDWGLGFLDGNVVKYISRWRQKGGLDDLKKARHYLDKLIEVEEGSKVEARSLRVYTEQVINPGPIGSAPRRACD